MDQNIKNETDAQALFSSWMKSATEFWGNVAKMPPFFEASEKPKTSGKEKSGHLYNAQKTWESGNKIFQTMLSMFSEPENLNALLRGTDALPEFVVHISQQVWDSYFGMQKKFVERAIRIGKHTEAYTFDDLDQDMFRSLREVYEREFQKIFNVPQIGLTRFYQERMNRLVDKANLFQSALNEFLYMFYVPLEKSFLVMQEKMEEMVDKGEIKDNFKDYYNMWVKTLEGHYMRLLKSPEYLEVMDNTIKSLSAYRQAKDDVFHDLLKNLPIPTNHDMDELYKEFYLLKKQVKEMKKQFESLSAKMIDKDGLTA